MRFMFAWYPPIPVFYNGSSVMLLLVLSVLGHMVSPFSPFHGSYRDKLAMWLPPAVFACWLHSFVNLFQPFGHFTWATNASICCGFGAAFSFRLLRIQSRAARLEGVCFLLLYGALVWLQYLLISPRSYVI